MTVSKKILLIGIAALIFVFIAIFFALYPSIELEVIGSKNLTINVGSEYKDDGAVAYLKSLFEKKELKVKSTGNVDTKIIGKYTINYVAKHSFLKKNKIRVVNVVDQEEPEIRIKNEIKICKKNNIIDIDAKAFDNYDGDISDKIKYRVDTDNIYISVEDSSMNKTELVKKLEYADNEKPVISLIGDNPTYINIGGHYEELGATASDSCDGNITEKIKLEGNIDENKEGTYEIVYTVSDSLLNETKAIRRVIVKDNETNYKKVENEGIIYLTFDDGPGQYTEQILNILNSNDIKATFFVTNQFPSYQYLIKNEYDAGHTVAVHTYSHKWSVYDSVDSYLNDFNSIQDVIESQTGSRSKYFRFPGGSSNRVSIQHSKGIMTELDRVMTDQGYIYFDWNVDSGDTHKNNTKDYIVKTVKKSLKGDGHYIILMHDIKKNTLEALPEIISYAKEMGYSFKAIDDNTPTMHFKIAN